MIWLIAILAFSSCTFPFNTQGYAEEGLGLSLEEAWERTTQYSYIWEESNYWKSPVEFERDGGGDCEDFAVYLMYLLGSESKMVIVEGTQENVYHTLVWYRGRFLEPQIYRQYSRGDRLKIYSWGAWEEVMSIATASGMKNLTPY
jgi:hypothetical protein